MNTLKALEALQAAGLPVEGVAADGRVDFLPGATAQQISDANAIVAAMDNLNHGAVNAKTTGAKQIAIVGESNKLWLPLMYRVALRAPDGVTSAARVSIGTNSPNYDNIQAAVTLTGWIDNDMQNFIVSTKTKVIRQPLPVYINIITAATAPGIYILYAEFIGDTKEI